MQVESFKLEINNLYIRNLHIVVLAIIYIFLFKVHFEAWRTGE